MKLEQLLDGLSFQILQGAGSREEILKKEIPAIVFDNRKVTKDCLFVCVKGMKYDSHEHLPELAEAGAGVIVVEREMTLPDAPDVTVLLVDSTRYAMAFMAAAWYGHPAEKMKIIGITGTKGKTTTTYLVKSILENENFNTLTLDYYSDTPIDPSTRRSPLDNAKLAVAACHSFIERFDCSFENLFFYGCTGVGKTFLSNCVAKALMDSGHSVLYFTSFQLFNILEESKFHQNADAKQQENDLFTCDLLIIDDLGTELTNSFSVSQLFLCLNERLLRRKSTIISSNLDLDKLFDTYSERNFSRIISNYTLLKLTGADIRLQKRTK